MFSSRKWPLQTALEEYCLIQPLYGVFNKNKYSICDPTLENLPNCLKAFLSVDVFKVEKCNNSSSPREFDIKMAHKEKNCCRIETWHDC